MESCLNELSNQQLQENRTLNPYYVQVEEKEVEETKKQIMADDKNKAKFKVHKTHIPGDTPPTIEETVQTFIYPGYSVDVCSYPSMVCSGCRRNLNLLKAGKQSRGAWGEKVAKVEWKMLTRTSSSSLIQQSPEPTVQASLESSLCSECLTTLAPGKTHNCSPSTAVLNMIFLAISLGSLQAEQVAAGLLKNKMDKENIQKRGKRACLWCEGVAGFECGNLRTLGSLDYWYERYITENNCFILKMTQILYSKP
ncbi:uncharacterized protein LOC111707897 [Eurytemora carolleeae]|uniref:uncharacterized protein LOC111707897 n=1 Tax=Eurytemora carolleeae TaxID=1294199 RepID=UPI000C7744EA|nr:uncharacterized protein LOC111707897 [Eurytemora carolleeae]|eukprot:XP_023336848.1 uncharacterized protein LOC111707897 [Eurytemora affinis]